MIENDEFLVIFQLSKPLSQFWKKGEGQWGENNIKTNNTVIEWGRYYREVLPLIWEAVDYSDDKYGITIARLNPAYDHNGDYYYAWAINSTG